MALQRLFVDVSVRALLMSSPGSAIQYVFQGRDLGGSFCGGLWLFVQFCLQSHRCLLYYLQHILTAWIGSFIDQALLGI